MGIPVHVQREIGRQLQLDPPPSGRAIAKAVGVSPSTVQSLGQLIHNTKQAWPALQALNDEEWERIVQTSDGRTRRRKAHPDWQWVHDELKKRDVTRYLLWTEWRETEPNGVAYTQFSDGYRAWLGRRKLSMRHRHRPGECLFADFCGHEIAIHGSTAADSYPAQIFVSTMGATDYTFAYAVRSQSVADWTACHVAAFEYYGGVPQWVVHDNLKAAVTKRMRDEILLNPSYRACLRHYGVESRPTRPRRPTDKGKGEIAVQIVQRWILAAVRNQVFRNLDELNGEIRRRLDEVNTRPFQRKEGCRRSQFEAIDCPALRPLPHTPYEFVALRYAVQVPESYHIECDGGFYSVPYQLAHTQVDLRIGTRSLEIYHRGKRVALHPLVETGERSCLLEHLPTHHRKVLEGEPLELSRWAVRVGPSTERLLQWHLRERKDGTNGLRAGQRLRHLGDLYGKARLEEACRYAVRCQLFAIKSLDSILKHNTDLRASGGETAATAKPHDHEFVRGAQYYGGSHVATPTDLEQTPCPEAPGDGPRL